jgi:hypothetical protein
VDDQDRGHAVNPLPLALCGAGIGLGLCVVLATILVPARPPLAAALAAPHRIPTRSRPKRGTLLERIGAPASGMLSALGLPRATVQADLRALDQPAEEHLAQQAALALIGALAGPVHALALRVVGIRVPLLVVVVATLLLAAAGYLLPSRLVHVEAEKLRAHLRYATSALLDLTAVMLAAGSGQEEAFGTAATAGSGVGHDLLRAALGAARTTRTPVWDQLGQLGERTGVPELTELAATSLLAGTEGAKIGDTLSTKAASLRARLLAAAEACAASATERMGMPTVLLMTGFLIFTCYPALAQVMASL